MARCGLSFPTITASIPATFSQEEALHWRLGVPFTLPPGGPRPWGAFAENVARRHFEDLAQLQAGLEHAFFSDVSEARPPRDRARIVEALDLITLHFAKQSLPPFLLHELLRFTTALKNLDRGTAHYSLERKKPANRPMLSGDLWEARAHVALAVDIMIEGGMIKKDALAIIESNYGFLADPLAPGAAKFGPLIAKWHEHLVAGSCKDADAQAFFRERQRYTEFLAAKIGSREPTRLAQEILKHATLLSARVADSAAIGKIASQRRRKTPTRGSARTQTK